MTRHGNLNPIKNVPSTKETLAVIPQNIGSRHVFLLRHFIGFVGRGDRDRLVAPFYKRDHRATALSYRFLLIEIVSY